MESCYCATCGNVLAGVGRGAKASIVAVRGPAPTNTRDDCDLCCSLPSKHGEILRTEFLSSSFRGVVLRIRSALRLLLGAATGELPDVWRVCSRFRRSASGALVYIYIYRGLEHSRPRSRPEYRQAVTLSTRRPLRAGELGGLTSQLDDALVCAAWHCARMLCAHISRTRSALHL
jgi:hypothetical protein